MRKLPPLNSMKAFEAAGRTISFTLAAAELGVTQGAISRQVKILEDWVGRKLFIRGNNHLVLTHSGQELLPEISGALDRVSHAIRRMRRDTHDLWIKVPLSFAMLWLLPRLSDFQSMYPDIPVHMTTAWLPVDLAAENFDAGIIYCPPTTVEMPGVLILTDRSIPICSPAYLKDAQRLAQPRDLLRHRLLMSSADGWEWKHWANAVGVPPPPLEDALGFDTEDAVVHAALDGYGVALAGLMLVAQELRLGHLVAPLAVDPVPQGCRRFVTRDNTGAPTSVKLFQQWLLSAARADDERATAIWNGESNVE